MINSRRRLLIVCGIAFLFLFPFLTPYKAMASHALVFMLFAMAFDVCLGYAGMLSFGHAAFFGLGAYTTGLLILHCRTNILGAVLAGAVLSLITAYPVGFIAIRRRGIYFAMVTLAFAQMCYFIAFKWVSLTGGDDGLQGIPRPDLFGLSLLSETRVYYFILAFLLMVLALALPLKTLLLGQGRGPGERVA
jgi:branched-chain amino acid transport system permease protein